MSDMTAAPAAPRLILASASPRRSELLREAGYEFVVHPSGVDEESFARAGAPSAYAQSLAAAKGDKVARIFPADVVLAADTVVAFGEMILGKPTDEKNARWMLTLLAGTTHIVITGISVQAQSAGFVKSLHVLSAVRMKPLTTQAIDRYVATRGWEGKAGGYGLQDADPFVERLSGCRTNIVGLPMTTTRKVLELAGILPKKATL
jgi:septum formation protein